MSISARNHHNNGIMVGAYNQGGRAISHSVVCSSRLAKADHDLICRFHEQHSAPRTRARLLKDARNTTYQAFLLLPAHGIPAFMLLNKNCTFHPNSSRLPLLLNLFRVKPSTVCVCGTSASESAQIAVAHRHVHKPPF